MATDNSPSVDKQNNVFDTLNNKDVSKYTETKNNLSYLSWATAWAEVKKCYPDAVYTVWKDENNKPFIFDEVLGYMVFTTVTINGLTHEMWLPVMDNNNKSMKSKDYSVKTKHKDIEVKAATMFDINTAIMRCLTKNLSMFGLGLYIYQGEDLPEEVKNQKEEEAKKAEEENNEKALKVEMETIASCYTVDELTKAFQASKLDVKVKNQLYKKAGADLKALLASEDFKKVSEVFSYMETLDNMTTEAKKLEGKADKRAIEVAFGIRAREFK